MMILCAGFPHCRKQRIPMKWFLSQKGIKQRESPHSERLHYTALLLPEDLLSFPNLTLTERNLKRLFTVTKKYVTILMQIFCKSKWHKVNFKKNKGYLYFCDSLWTSVVAPFEVLLPSTWISGFAITSERCLFVSGIRRKIKWSLLLPSESVSPFYNLAIILPAFDFSAINFKS